VDTTGSYLLTASDPASGASTRIAFYAASSNPRDMRMEAPSLADQQRVWVCGCVSESRWTLDVGS
jgi:hypothetical protein